MNNPQTQELLTAVMIAAMGAGIVTSFAVSQGQNPLIATAITIISALCAVIFHQADLV